MDRVMESSRPAGAKGAERSVTDIVRDMATATENIIRSEVQLAKIEVKGEVAKVKAAGGMFGVAAVAAFFGIGFCLASIAYALALILPAWAAALIVGVPLLIIAGALALAGRYRLSQVKPPEKTMFTVKENVEWMSSQSKS